MLFFYEHDLEYNWSKFDCDILHQQDIALKLNEYLM